MYDINVNSAFFRDPSIHFITVPNTMSDYIGPISEIPIEN